MYTLVEYAHKRGTDVPRTHTHAFICRYEDTFKPVLVTVDRVSGERSRYTGVYSFELVGGGPTRETIEDFTADEVALYNLGEATVWTFTDVDALEEEYSHLSEKPVLSVQRSTVGWVCSPSSPCAGVAPRFPDTPEYYFKIRVSTEAVATTSYCAYETELVVRVHGLPLNFGVVAATVTTSLLAGFLVVVALFFLAPAMAGHSEGSPSDDAVA